MSTQVQYRYLLTSGNDVITVDVEGPAVQLVSCLNTSSTAPPFPTCASVSWGPQSLLYGLWIKHRLANADWKTCHITSRLWCVMSHVLISQHFSKLFTRTPNLNWMYIIRRKN